MNRMFFGVALGLLTGVVGFVRPTAEAAPEPTKLQPVREADPLPPPTNRDRPVNNSGRAGKVLGLTADSITIQGHDASWWGGKVKGYDRNGVTFIGEGITFYGRDGDRAIPTLTGVEATVTREWFSVTAANGKVTTVRRADLPPRRYKMSAILAAGDFPPDALDCRTYRLKDVRIGDEVAIDIRWADGEWTCTTIMILRRPGGRVPPSNKPDKADPWHERANALQDWEYNGTPLPEKYHRWPKLEVPRDAAGNLLPDKLR